MSEAQSLDARFAELSNRFLDAYLKAQPTRATELGDHRYDGAWPDVTKAGMDKLLALIAEQQKALAAVPEDRLSLQNKIDRQILSSELSSWEFSIKELRDYENNPLMYTGLIGDGLDPLMTREFAPVEERLKSLLSRLKGVPDIVKAAKENLKSPPSVHTETAILQNKGLVALCDKGLSEHFDKAPALKAELTDAAKKATEALKDFQTFLEKDLAPRSKGDFRLGRERFEKKLRFSLDDQVDIDALAKSARELLVATQGEMFDTAKELWPTLLPKEKLPEATTEEDKKKVVKRVLDELAKEHPSNDTIVKDAEKTLEEATKFVREKDLVTVPTEPCKIIEMPEYRRGVAIAYCDASGPLEKKQETFYAISPTPKDWDKKRADSFYREYNQSMLYDLTVHEAMPGHFLQIMHANKFPSKIRAVMSSGPFVEGWAVYTEWLMSKHGFGGPKVRMQRQKMVLRMCANAILDHDIHAGTMDEKQALALMMGDAFQEEGEAIGKWRRARLTSAQLTTYFYGFVEMKKLREKYEKNRGFSERAYHDRLLSFGSPPPRHAKTLMESAP